MFDSPLIFQIKNNKLLSQVFSFLFVCFSGLLDSKLNSNLTKSEIERDVSMN